MSDNYQGSLIFMTDPLCSWCWGTLPEILKVKSQLGERLEFQIRCAGLQLGSRKPLGATHRKQLLGLWHEVATTTGQRFAFTLPDDAAFIYHSELACRALTLARQHLNEEPWELLYRMQEAFYVEAADVGDLEALFNIFKTIDISWETFADAITGAAVVDATRLEFEWCKARAIHALPTVFLDLGQGPELVCGGYVTAEYLAPDLSARLHTH